MDKQIERKMMKENRRIERERILNNLLEKGLIQKPTHKLWKRCSCDICMTWRVLKNE